MSIPRKVFALLLTLCCTALVVSADVLLLKDGQAITGRFQGADQSTVSFSARGQTRVYSISEINSITFSAPPSEGAQGPPRDTPTLSRRSGMEGEGGMNPGPSADMGAPPPPLPPPPQASGPLPPKPMFMTIHAGSVVTVRMIDPVDSSTDQMGQTYRATLDEPLVEDGKIAVPRGADITVKLASKKEAGRMTGRSELNLVLLDIMVEGRRHEITTSEATESGASRGKQTATRVGIGTVLGAAIGAVAGGGKGAAIGAATGAGAGGAVQVMTHGDKVKIPSETRLDFTLSEPLVL